MGERGDIHVRVGETGDSPTTLQDRAFRGVRALFSELPPEASVVLIVAHFWVNRALLATWMGKDLSQLGEIQQPNAAVNVVDVRASDIGTAEVHIVGWQPTLVNADAA